MRHDYLPTGGDGERECRHDAEDEPRKVTPRSISVMHDRGGSGYQCHPSLRSASNRDEDVVAEEVVLSVGIACTPYENASTRTPVVTLPDAMTP